MEPRSNFDHYVAQHYIRLFADSMGIAYVGDIVNRTVGPYSDFSRILGRENWSVDQSIENGFSLIETSVASAMRTLNTNPDSISGLATRTGIALRSYICMHYARSVGVQDAMDQSTAQSRDEIG